VISIYNKPDYPVVAGLVQFEPKERQLNGQDVRDLKVRAFGTQQETWITVWPEHGHVPLTKGDFIVVQGKRREWTGTDRDGNPRSFTGVDAKTLIRVAPADRHNPSDIF
jgi:hypothetical protein